MFDSAQSLRNWNAQEYQFWQWVHRSPENPYADVTRRNYEGFHSQIEQWANQWDQHRDNLDFLKQNSTGLQNVFNQYVDGSLVIIRDTPDAAFIEAIRKSDGEVAAMTAYSYLTVSSAGRNTFPQPKFFDGLVAGFLFRHEVDWTATAHHEVLTRLKNQYAGNISHQDARFKELEEKNDLLTTQFDTELAAKRDALQNLHVEQSEAFKALVGKYDEQLTIIEQTYDKKLALQKPVMYWETKEKYHARLSKIFAGVALGATGALVALMILVINWLFGNLPSGQDPRHWQIGILATAAFFSIWTVRILLKLFFSHIHLASDAAERRTMILTYLALSREGADVAPEDRKLILQHLFRSASDGLVKDDTAPPSILEYLTRSK